MSDSPSSEQATKAPVMVDIAEVRKVVTEAVSSLTAASVIAAVFMGDRELSNMIASPTLELMRFVEEVERRG